MSVKDTRNYEFINYEVIMIDAKFIVLKTKWNTIIYTTNYLKLKVLKIKAPSLIKVRSDSFTRKLVILWNSMHVLTAPNLMSNDRKGKVTGTRAGEMTK